MVGREIFSSQSAFLEKFAVSFGHGIDVDPMWPVEILWASREAARLGFFKDSPCFRRERLSFEKSPRNEVMPIGCDLDGRLAR
jgi:hypothetical protein